MLFYAGVTVLFTWPAITLTSRTYAEPRDPLLYIWWTWWFRFSFQNRLPVSPISIISVPFGYKWSIFAQESATNLSLRSLSIVAGETVAYNVFLLVSMFLGAALMYWLVKRMTASRAGAAVAGAVFGFCPYALMHDKEHIVLATIFLIPAFAATLFYAYRKRTLVSFIVCGAALVVVTAFNSHYGLLCAFMLVVFCVVVFIAGRPWRKKKRDFGLVKALPVVVVVLVLLVLLVSVSKNAPRGGTKDLDSLYRYSARPWDYVVPGPDGALLGWATRSFVASHLHGGFAVENTLFLGFVPLLLAALAVVLFATRRRRTPQTGADAPVRPAPLMEDRRVTWALLLLVPAAFLMSMPPSVKLLGLRIYMPSYLVHYAVPGLRSYSRFGLLVVFAVAVLAAYGVAWLSRGRRGWRVPLAAAAVIVLVLLEFTVIPPFRSLDTATTTDYYRWLASRPGSATTAIYPFYYSDDFYSYRYLFDQRHHRKKLLNGALPDSDAERWRQVLLDPSFPSTPGVLARMGARYILVVNSNYASAFHLNYPFRSPPPTTIAGTRVAARFHDCTVYEITARKTEFVALFGLGTTEAFVDKAGSSWHPSAGTTAVDLTNYTSGEALCDLSLSSMTVSGTAVTKASLNGAPVAEFSSSRAAAPVTIKGVTLKAGLNQLVFETAGTNAPLQDVPGYESISVPVLIGDIETTAR